MSLVLRSVIFLNKKDFIFSVLNIQIWRCSEKGSCIFSTKKGWKGGFKSVPCIMIVTIMFIKETIQIQQFLTKFLCFGIFIALKFNICWVNNYKWLMLDVGSILGVVLACTCCFPCFQCPVPGRGFRCCWPRWCCWGRASRCPTVGCWGPSDPSA